VLGDDVEAHADVLLQPSVIYSPEVVAAAAEGGVRSAAHVTGGGLAANLSRALPEGLGADIDTTSWERPAVFDLVADRGVPEEEMRTTFNLGIGFCLVVDPKRVDEVVATTAVHEPRPIGVVGDTAGIRLS
jgi:phosphoribosylformylglycinamidine cyclo-ligase